MTDNLTDDLSHIPEDEREDYRIVRQKIIDAIESGATELEVFRKSKHRRGYENIYISQLPPEFAQLAPNLTHLSLKLFERLQNIAPLQQCNKLQHLHLSGWHELSDITPLSGLVQLQHLDLMNCKQLSDFTSLTGLVQLQHLDLSWCTQLSDITPLSGLVQLQYLILSGCDKLSNIKPLSGLDRLQHLDLNWCYQLSDITPLSGLVQLQQLNLINCYKISDLTPLTKITHLVVLILGGAIKLLPFSTLQALLKLPKLTEFHADNLYIPGVPFELTKEISDFQVLRDWYADVQQGFVPSNRIKLHLLGNGRIGKTQLARRLANKRFDAGIASTHGIQISTWPITISLPGEQGEYNEQQYRETEITVCNWDFGGQDVYLSTHSLFLDDQAVYAVLWHPGYENTEVVEVPALPVIPATTEHTPSKELASPDNLPTLQLRNRHLSYWLAYLHSLVGSNAPVVVAQSQCDSPTQCQTAPLPHDLPFEFLKTSHCSAMNTVDGLDELLPALKSALKLQQQRIGEVMLPTSWMQVADAIDALKQQGQKTLSVDDYLMLCDGSNNGVSLTPTMVSAPETLLQYLHNSGQVFYKQGLFDNQLILDQSWALQGVYSLLERGSSLPALVRNEGKFTSLDLQDWLWHKAGYSDDEQRLFLGMMQQCGICFVIEQKYGDEEFKTNYLAPDCLPKREQLANAIARVWQNKQPTLQVQLHYDFLHDAVARQVLCSIGKQAGSGAHYWRYGCCFYALEYNTNFELNCVFYHDHPGRFQEQARLEDLLQNHGQPGFIEITASGESSSKAKEFVEEIVDSIVKEQRLSRKPSVQWLMGFDEQKGQHQREHHDQSGNSGNGEMPQFTAETHVNREPAQPGSAKVYFSYAWGKGDQQHQAIADEVAEALDAEPGIQLMRDKDAMKPGDSIKRFIQEVGQAYQVVVIFSAKYLTSEHCMRELAYLYKASTENEYIFKQRVIPVVLDEVDIDSASGRKAHLTYWKTEAEGLEAVAKQGLDAKLTEDARLYRDIADSVYSALSWSADILLNRNWDAAENDNFAELIALVKQRIRENQNQH